tara:strand:+ start:217 stop:981 length:765 start_codon:yes stop_codon:yes gene_type:complete
MKILLMGGIGNRLFQISYALSVTNVNKDVTLITMPVYFEKLAAFFGWSVHEEWLDLEAIYIKFNLKNRKALLYELFIISFLYLLRKVFSNFSYEIKINNIEKESYFLDYAVGYFQDISFHDVKALTVLIEELSNNFRDNPEDYPCLHIRGGDFDVNDRIDKDFLKKINFNSHLKIVTNDIDYVNSIFTEMNFELISNNNPADDFKILCNSNLLHVSNSTYSFWAACVVFASGGEVISPKNFKYKNFFEFLKYYD